MHSRINDSSAAGTSDQNGVSCIAHSFGARSGVSVAVSDMTAEICDGVRSADRVSSMLSGERRVAELERELKELKLAGRNGQPEPEALTDARAAFQSSHPGISLKVVDSHTTEVEFTLNDQSNVRLITLSPEIGGPPRDAGCRHFVDTERGESGPGIPLDRDRAHVLFGFSGTGANGGTAYEVFTLPHHLSGRNPADSQTVSVMLLNGQYTPDEEVEVQRMQALKPWLDEVNKHIARRLNVTDVYAAELTQYIAGLNGDAKSSVQPPAASAVLG